MEYFITANGSVLRYDAERKEISISEKDKVSPEKVCWHPLHMMPSKLPNRYYVHDSEYKNLAIVTLPEPGEHFGSFITTQDIEIPFMSMNHVANTTRFKIDWQNNDDVEAFLRDYIKRADAAQIVRTMAPAPTRFPTAPKTVPTINSYNELKQFADVEIKRLRKKWFNKNDKIGKIHAASIWADFAMPDFDEELGEPKALEALKQESYIMIARESGLINALNRHRFHGKKEKMDIPPKSMERLEAACPGITKAI